MIQLANGKYWDHRAPDPSLISIELIAASLSKQCRFSGHTRRFYCPTPDQRVLTADLRWVPAGELMVGDKLLGFDEHPHEFGAAGTRRRRYRGAEVTHAVPVRRRLESEKSHGYVVITIEGVPYYAHRLAWFYMKAEWPEQEVDHEDLNGLNNRWSNLRAASHAQNNQNTSLRSDNTSGVRGVSYDRRLNRWRARLHANGRVVLRKNFSTPEEAASAYAAAAQQHHAEFARIR